MGSTKTGEQQEIAWSEITEWTPKQATAIEATHEYRYVLYGGARGGGKSYLLRWFLLELLVDLYQYRGMTGVRVGLFCETYPDLQDRQISKIKQEFPPWMGVLKETKTDGLGFFLSDKFGGGMLALRNLDDPSKYQSSEFAAIAVDELTKNQLSTFNILRGSLRWPGIIHTVLIGATNPGGPGHLWVKQYWIDKQFPPELKARAHEFKFIQSLPADNPHLEQSYWDELDSLPPNLRKAWVLGDWDVFEGMAFPGWDRERHVIKPYDIPEWWPRWRAVDWGTAAPFCCLWFTKNPDNQRVIVYREVYQTGMTDTDQANVILANTPEEGVNITYADPSMWTKKNVKNIVSSSADEYLEIGVPLTKADNDRMGGKRKVDRMLMNLEDGEPGLLIFDTCKNLIRTLPALPYDEKKVEDVDTDAEDHAYDTLRYGVTNVKAQKVKKTTRQKSPIERLGRIT